jgi:hypothetical protein
VIGLCLGVTLLIACGIVLTGDVYYKKLDEGGRLRKWSGGNKVVAVVMLVVWCVAALRYCGSLLAGVGAR